MAEFPDHARLWLSSYTSFNDVVPSEFNLLQSRVSSMDDLTHRLAALTLLKQRRGLGLQRFSPPVTTGYLDSQYCRSYLCGFCNGIGAHVPGTELYHHYSFPNPVQPQVGDGSFLEARVRALSMHHNQAQIRHQNQNCLFQFQGNGIARMGVFERVSGGTGVFIPRVSASTITTMSPEVKKKSVSFWVNGSMTGLKNKRETSGIQQRNSMNNGAGMGEEHHQLRPDVVLPQEWTY